MQELNFRRLLAKDLGQEKVGRLNQNFKLEYVLLLLRSTDLALLTNLTKQRHAWLEKSDVCRDGYLVFMEFLVSINVCNQGQIQIILHPMSQDGSVTSIYQSQARNINLYHAKVVAFDSRVHPY